jgi:GT2 family glycosyltransferase/MoaA/NifB/PqqE/SkfB family radical SAM enzyme
MEKEIDIIITTYNGSKTIKKLLNSIKEQTFNSYNCFVIDDDSRDNTVQIIEKHFPWVKLIKQQNNFGPAHNRNVAAREGRSKFMVFFDDDVFLSDNDWLRKGIEKMHSEQNIGQLSTMVVSGHDDDILLDCGICNNRLFFGGIYHKLNKNFIYGKHLISRNVLGACSAGTIVRRDVFEKIGGFDKKYFYMSEDLDLSLRIHLLGYDVIYYPALVTHHLESKTMGGKNAKKKIYLYYRNNLLAFFDNYPLIYAVKALFFYLLISIISSIFNLFLKLIFKLKKDYFPGSVNYLKIIFFIIINLPNILIKRWKIGRISKRSRDYLIKLNSQLLKETQLKASTVESLILSVTNKCNAKCKMCFQYEDINKNSNLLSLDEMRKLSFSLKSLSNLVLTGGEPFLRNDIDQICEIFIKSSNPAITIPTNGSLPEVSYGKIKKILASGCKKLLISFSLDGDSTYHDENRGIKGLFDKVYICYKKLEKIKLIYGDILQIQINTCISRENIDMIENLNMYISKKMPFANWVIEPIRGTFDSEKTTPLDLDEWGKIKGKISKLILKNNSNIRNNLVDLYIKAISTLKQKKQIIPCCGGYEFITIDHEGNIYPCEILPAIENVRNINYDMSQIMNEQGWENVLKKIKNSECYCTHFCWLDYSSNMNSKIFKFKSGLKKIKKVLEKIIWNRSFFE